MDGISRRKFVMSLTVLSGALAVLPFVADADDQPATPVTWTNVGDVKTFPVGVPTAAAYPSPPGKVFVTVAADNTVTALLPKCTHHGCTVAFVTATDIFQCPCHGAQYSAAGVVLRGPARRPLPSLQAKVDKGAVWVEAPASAPPAG